MATPLFHNNRTIEGPCHIK